MFTSTGTHQKSNTTISMESVNPTTGTGLCSCLTVRLSDTCDYYRKNGTYPDEIDSRGQFTMYKDFDTCDVSRFLLSEYEKDPELSYVPFNCGWQYGWADDIQIDKLSEMAYTICHVSQRVGDKAYDMSKRLADRTAVLYRGNDKSKEIPTAEYEMFFQMAMDTGSKKFLVQTDEREFYHAFKKEFPDTICFHELPMINKNVDSYVLPPKGQRVEFAVNFIAALKCIGQAKKIILATGNTSLWAILFRGNHNNVWQFNGNLNTWKKI